MFEMLDHFDFYPCPIINMVSVKEDNYLLKFIPNDMRTNELYSIVIATNPFLQTKEDEIQYLKSL